MSNWASRECLRPFKDFILLTVELATQPDSHKNVFCMLIPRFNATWSLCVKTSKIWHSTFIVIENSKKVKLHIWSNDRIHLHSCKNYLMRLTLSSVSKPRDSELIVDIMNDSEEREIRKIFVVFIFSFRICTTTKKQSIKNEKSYYMRRVEIEASDESLVSR